MDLSTVKELFFDPNGRWSRLDTWWSGRRGRHDRVQGLLDLAEQLQEVLVPVQPAGDFRRRLHGDLVLRAQCRQVEPRRGLFQQHRKGILIGAAAVGSVASIVGVIIAFVVRSRHNRVTHVATG